MATYLSCIYQEPDPATYQGFQLRCQNANPEVFNTGHPTVDYLTAGFVAHYRLGPSANIMGSSSLDHFVMDGGEDIDGGTPEQIMEASRIAKRYLDSRGECPFKLTVEHILEIPGRGIYVCGPVQGFRKANPGDALEILPKEHGIIRRARLLGFELTNPAPRDGTQGILLAFDGPIHPGDVLKLPESA